MEKLSINELNALRVTILNNAKALKDEAKILHAHNMHSRAYLLAHFCIEELGKLPIIVGVVSKLTINEPVDWKKVKKRFCSHTEKIGSQNGHFYTFSTNLALEDDADLKWLLTANKEIPETYRKKNLSTYVDVKHGKVLDPLNEISKADAGKLIDFAIACINAHERSESLINPFYLESKEVS
jgi:AbiV family abortive infection protein